jgi:hypothetical protein
LENSFFLASVGFCEVGSAGAGRLSGSRCSARSSCRPGGWAKENILEENVLEENVLEKKVPDAGRSGTRPMGIICCTALSTPGTCG